MGKKLNFFLKSTNNNMIIDEDFEKKVSGDNYSRKVAYLIRKLTEIINGAGGDLIQDRARLNNACEILLQGINVQILRSYPILYKIIIQKVKDCAEIAGLLPGEDLKMVELYYKTHHNEIEKDLSDLFWVKG